MDNNRKPEWLKVKFNAEAVAEVAEMMKRLKLNTVCREANCPNLGECFGRHTATFMILGRHCTRNCKFCNVIHSAPDEVDASEPAAVAEAVVTLKLHHAVITSVTRDDLPDGGAAHFAAVIRAIREASPDTTVEVLIPDFKGDMAALDTVLEARPDVLGHNIETVRRLYDVRPGADYDRTLGVLRYCKEKAPDIYTKTGFMVGLGETDAEISGLMRDIRETGCDILTIGQYLRPSEEHAPLDRYVTPEGFAAYKAEAESLGFAGVVSLPLARSSYLAEEALEKSRK